MGKTVSVTRLTGVALTRVALTRVALTRVALTRVALTGVALTGVALTRVALTVPSVASRRGACSPPTWWPPACSTAWGSRSSTPSSR